MISDVFPSEPHPLIPPSMIDVLGSFVIVVALELEQNSGRVGRKGLVIVIDGGLKFCQVVRFRRLLRQGSMR